MEAALERHRKPDQHPPVDQNPLNTNPIIVALFEGLVLIDSSAVIALYDESEALHTTAQQFFENQHDLTWLALNVTSHESFTRLRYDTNLKTAIAGYQFLRSNGVRPLTFTAADEDTARRLIEKYTDKKLSFHDALCAAVMLREGIFRIFTFDSDFWAFGFQVLPGNTR